MIKIIFVQKNDYIMIYCKKIVCENNQIHIHKITQQQITREDDGWWIFKKAFWQPQTPQKQITIEQKQLFLLEFQQS